MKKVLILMLVFMTVLGAVISSAGAAQDHRVLKVVSPWKFKGIDPAKSGFIFSRMGVMEMLTTTDDKGKLIGALAKSWQVSEDKLTWTFNLRPNVLFHDKTPMSPEDVAMSLNHSLASKGKLTQAGILEIKPGKGLTLMIRTQKPFTALPAYLAHYSAGIISRTSFDSDGKTVVKLIGTGPYQVQGMEGGILARFTADESYWGEPPFIEKTEYHAVPSGETRVFMLKAGQADMAFTLPPSAVQALQGSAAAQVDTLTIPRVRLMILNCNLPFFSDIRVRQALSLAIDRKGIAKALLRNPGSAASQLLPPAVALWHDSNLDPLKYDMAKARKLLAETGWIPGPDQILVKSGQRFEFELVTYANRPMLPPVAAAIQHQLKQVGIQMNIRVGESSQVPEKHKDGTLEAALVARNFGLVPDAVGTIYGDYGPNPGSWGAMGWKSAELNRILDAYLDTISLEKADKARKKILNLIQTQLPVIPVTWYEHIVGTSKRITGVHIDPFELRSYVEGVKWAD